MKRLLIIFFLLIPILCCAEEYPYFKSCPVLNPQEGELINKSGIVYVPSEFLGQVMFEWVYFDKKELKKLGNIYIYNGKVVPIEFAIFNGNQGFKKERIEKNAKKIYRKLNEDTRKYNASLTECRINMQLRDVIDDMKEELKKEE